MIKMINKVTYKFYKCNNIVRTNIQINLAQRLKDITFKLRKREKKHFLKV